MSTEVTLKDPSLGYGLSFAGKIPLWGQDDLRFTFSGGDGFGRYLALNTVGDAMVDASGKLRTVEVYNGFTSPSYNPDGLGRDDKIDTILRDWFNFLSIGKVVYHHH